MAERTGIGWTDATWNPVRGCTRVSPGCVNCYAEALTARHSGTWGEGFAEQTPAGPRWTRKVELIPSMLDRPLRWRKPRMIFVNSLSDLFHPALSNEVIAAVFGVMAACPQHTFQILTKHPERASKWFDWATRRTIALGLPRGEADFCVISAGIAMELPEFMAPNHGWALPNVWLGTSAEDQQRADERIPFLLECPAVVRFVSYEPALEAVRFARWMRQCTFGWAASGGGCGDCDPCVWTAAQDGRFLNWLVIGGESGPNRRPFDLAWLESVAEQCDTAGVPLFVKQDGAFRPGEQGRIPDRLWARKEFPR